MSGEIVTPPKAERSRSESRSTMFPSRPTA